MVLKLFILDGVRAAIRHSLGFVCRFFKNLHQLSFCFSSVLVMADVVKQRH